jgi:poly(A) polymerase
MHFGRQAVQDACIISQAQARDTSWQAAILMARDLPEPKLPVGGADLMARGMKAGKAVGEALADIEKNWIAAGFPEDAQAVDALVTAALAACAK